MQILVKGGNVAEICYDNFSKYCHVEGDIFLPVSVSASAAWAKKQKLSIIRVVDRSHTAAILQIIVSLKDWFKTVCLKTTRIKLSLFSQNSSCSSCIGALYWTFANASTSLNLEIILMENMMVMLG